MTFELIIFDCDGVLVDSEVLSCDVFSAMLTKHGFPMTALEVHARFLGRSAKQARAEIEAQFGRALTPDYDTEIKSEMTRVLTERLQPIPGVADALARLPQKRCVASSGTPDRIRSSLTLTGLRPFFDPHIFSAWQVENGKPAPDLFLFAAAQMGVDPARCLVIEDSLPGVKGARAAGMAVAGFCGGGHCSADHARGLREAGATAIFADMLQLPHIVAELSGAGAPASVL